MTITRIFPDPMDDSASATISDLIKDDVSSYENLRQESLLNIIGKNLGFVIIVLMLIGAFVWAVVMFLP